VGEDARKHSIAGVNKRRRHAIRNVRARLVELLRLVEDLREDEDAYIDNHFSGVRVQRHRRSHPRTGRGRFNMTTELARTTPARPLATADSGFLLPAIIANQGDKAAERFFAWTHAKRLSLPAIKSYHVSAYR
jgi:hypothetical protein